MEHTKQRIATRGWLYSKTHVWPALSSALSSTANDDDSRLFWSCKPLQNFLERSLFQSQRVGPMKNTVEPEDFRTLRLKSTMEIVRIFDKMTLRRSVKKIEGSRYYWHDYSCRPSKLTDIKIGFMKSIMQPQVVVSKWFRAMD